MKTCLPVLFLVLAMVATNSLGAQEYKSAIGARLGSPLSASFKTFISESSAIELFVNYRGDNIAINGYGWNRFGLGGAWQKHSEISVPGLSWYAGAGATAYYWSWSNDVFFDDYNNLSFGLQGYVGVDYAFENIPLNLSVDWVPTYFLNGYIDGFGADYGAISARYILSR